MPTIIHVNRNLIHRNKRDGGHRPVYAVKFGTEIIYAQAVSIEGRVTFVDPRSAEPLSCGATIYALVEGEVTLTDPVKFKDI